MLIFGIPIINDLQASKLLTSNERECLTRALMGLTFLDTLQAEKGLPNMQEDLTHDAQLELHVLKQFEMMECVHSKSYSSIFSTILSTEEINSAFLWSEENKRLQHKGYLITEKYVGSCPLERRQSSVYLESFLFYSGFFYPLLLNDTRRLTNIADVIKLINRDEAIHGFYIGYKYQQMVEKESLERQKELKERAYDMLVELFENEVEYAKELYDEVGLTDQVLKYMEFNANRALKNLGYEPLFTVLESELNPIVLKGLSNGVNHDFFSLAGSSYTLMPTGDVDDSIKKDLLAHFNK